MCEALSEGPDASRVKVRRVGIRDTFGTSAQKYEELLETYHLTPHDIAEATKSAIR